jgi:hypothetical protein
MGKGKERQAFLLANAVITRSFFPFSPFLFSLLAQTVFGFCLVFDHFFGLRDGFLPLTDSH